MSVMPSAISPSPEGENAMLDGIKPTLAKTFFDLIAAWKAAESVGTDDVLTVMRPLLQDVAEAHERGEVARLDRVDTLVVADRQTLEFVVDGFEVPTTNDDEVRRIEQPRSAGVQIVGDYNATQHDDGSTTWANRAIVMSGDAINMPVFLPRYSSWELEIGHHDALTDIYHLGLIMASLAGRLDFMKLEDLQTFVRHRRNLQRVNPRLHPVVARVIGDMTEPSRAKRAADLGGLIATLDTYRQNEIDDAEIKARQLGTIDDPAERRRRRLEYLRNRLFEITRRNRLVYFQPRHGVDLTHGSFPLMLNVNQIRLKDLVVSNREFCQLLAKGHDGDEASHAFDLRQWLKFEDYPWLANAIDKVRVQAKKDQKELGFNQLRMVMAFLRWHDLRKEGTEREERIHSPLILLPVELGRQTGTTDGFQLTLAASVTKAEINPVLRYHLADAFDIELPETIDLTQPGELAKLQQSIEMQMRLRHAGVEVALIERPRVQMIQRTVTRSLEDYKRRAKRAGRQLKDFAGIAYSYAQDGYQPLGLELYDRFVRDQPAPGREMVGKGAIEAEAPASAQERSAAREFYSFGAAETNDPLNWELDLTAVTLSNFNARKMSLVRDYAHLLGGYNGPHHNYTRLFDANVRPSMTELAKPGHAERHLVLPADPSQEAAVLRARTSTSYVIQGPPGTGKSQTIANLLADYAARGKSVLFVCEKRVALDVVNQRLKEAGLDDLTCLVHDARDDRKEFIEDLKRIYESWSAQSTAKPSAALRDACLKAIDADIATLTRFSDVLQAPGARAEEALRRLIDRAISAGREPAVLTNKQRELLPGPAEWDQGGEIIRNIDHMLATTATAGDPASLKELARRLSPELGRQARPIEFMTSAIRASRAAMTAASGALNKATETAEVPLADLLTQARIAAELQTLASRQQLHLLDPHHAETTRLKDELAALARFDRALTKAEEPNGGWAQKLSADDTQAALAIARAHEASFWSFLSGQWRSLKTRIRQQHNGAVLNHVALLERLAAEHAARAAHDEQTETIRARFHLDDVVTESQSFEPYWSGDRAQHPAARRLLDDIQKNPRESARTILDLARDKGTLEQANDHLSTLFRDAGRQSPARLAADLNLLEASEDLAPELGAQVTALDAKAPGLSEAWRELPLDADSLQTAILHDCITRSLKADRAVERMDSAGLQELSKRLAANLTRLRDLNVACILDDSRRRFNDARGRATDANSEYAQGQKFLEHQFALQRPSGAMRDFLSPGPASVVRDLKPIWMMSPLSVADTLPLVDDLFDVVIFDEASQIPLEDAIPTLYRAHQCIIVGDEMQLPPSSFFAARGDDDGEELPDYLAFGMTADSLLTKAITALPSTRLDWHYRSRHESLIGFCNLAFYGGGLKTIPSRQPLAKARAIPVGEKATLSVMSTRVTDRPISLHKVPDGRFEQQTNDAEALYIANLVRALLSEAKKKSIGIVAFSQAQSEAIEEALEQVADQNPSFRSRLDAEREREEDGQFVGLFVKNLENVQGDERDIIIISVGYGPGPTGKMLMNFGPINQAGGEKRLNVIFSRAKHHVALVTSIEASQITNDYNPGANALKQYLRYAGAVSTGDAEGMQAALRGFPGAAVVGKSADASDPLADALAASLAGGSLHVARNLGQSTIRCDLALKKPNAKAYDVAVLVDGERHYSVQDIVDRYVTQPELLRASGWDVRFALGKDWLLAREALLKALGG
jgi:hypothetical protein